MSALGEPEAALLAPSRRDGDLSLTWREAELTWRQRHERASLALAIELYERGALEPSPGLEPGARRLALVALYVRLARAHHLMADGHLRAEDPQEHEAQIIAHFERGLRWAERAIALADPALAKRAAEDHAQLARGIDQAAPEAYEALYWYTVLRSQLLALEGLHAVVAWERDALTLMSHLHQRAPTLFYGGPGRFLGVFYTRVPLGAGDPRASMAAFERSVKLAPNYLETRVLMAREYATLIQDRKLFERQLRHVIQTPASVVPHLEPENLLAQRKARLLLQRLDALFYAPMVPADPRP